MKKLMEIVYDANSIETGDHILFGYDDKDEMFDNALEYFKKGLDENESIMMITGHFSKNEVIQKMKDKLNLDIESLLKSEKIFITSIKDWFYPDGQFDFKQLNTRWDNFTDISTKKGSGLRVWVDNEAIFADGLEGKFVEYEATLSEKFENALTVVCAYSNKFLKKLDNRQITILHQHHKTTGYIEKISLSKGL